ncbi:SH3 domain-containing protein [uncultured Tenacibaculum sp.]|uniref:SH3 domain-containing protein n=1 Tax=uncultured Tenacibaculum sp. TaxID=174713 RepID=UPI0026167E26|nr:SH3 domain-containing protein [uncultured Tenacibaculum sp.]
MKKLFITIVSLSILFMSCKGGDKSEKTAETATEESEVKTSTAICLLDKLSIRETPSAKGKWITSMSLGESVTFTEEEETDVTTKKLYYKVKLTDGKEGWTRATFLAVNGKVGAMLEEASMYKRPDLLTKTDKKYSVMDIIAVTENKGDWMKVKGRRTEGEYIEEGWIKSSNISNDEIDIATAKFARSAMSKSTMTERIKALEEVINNQDLSSSKFINVLKSKIADYKTKNVAIDVKDVKVEEVAK